VCEQGVVSILVLVDVSLEGRLILAVFFSARNLKKPKNFPVEVEKSKKFRRESWKNADTIRRI
jgi:hypothetical protein